MAKKENIPNVIEQMNLLTAGERIDFLTTFLINKQEILKTTTEDYTAALTSYLGQVKSVKETIKNGRESAWKATKEKLETNVRAVVLAIVIVATGSAFLTLGVMTTFQPALDPTAMPLNPGSQITFLGLVLALAAYLAAVARTLKDKLGALKEAQNFDGAKITTHADNLMRIIRAEALLVGLGILTGGRIVVGPLMGSQIKYFDYFLLVYLFFTIVYLAFLHAKQWTYQPAAAPGSPGA